jgi:ribosome recycling factor
MATTDDIISEHSKRMDKALENLKSEFATVRTGRASAAVLDRVTVDYYGTPTPVTQIASVKSPEAHLLVVEPWDKSIAHAVEEAIQKSDLGITPNNDGSGVIRLPFPPPTEERRRELVKQCKSLAEEAKVGVRNVRRDANNKIEKLVKDEDLSKDDVHRAEERVQKLTDEHVKQIDDALANKESEVMEV